MKNRLKVTYIGGPTALLEMSGLRFLTDPTFDAAGSEYKTSLYTLHKTSGPAVDREALGRIDAVLLSHDHHFDNLDRAGRSMLAEAGMVLTTAAGADRLGANARPITPWQEVELKTPDGGVLHVTGTPARHGPPTGDRGPVTGFLLTSPGSTDRAVYISGDTVWYEGAAEVGRRFKVGVAILFMGAARVPEVGPAHLTFTAEEGVEAARTFQNAVIIPLHYEGWGHFSESREQIEVAFVSAGLNDRLRWMEPGKPTILEL